VLQLVAAAAQRRRGRGASSAAPPSAGRLPAKPLLLDNPTAGLPSGRRSRARAVAVRPRRAAVRRAAAALGDLKTVDPAALTALAATWTAAGGEAGPALDASASLMIGAPVAVARSSSGRAARLAGVLVKATASAWHVAVAGGRVVVVPRVGSRVVVPGGGEG